jgi:phosphatidylserine/phosphatidylglycerophosphate/cardiolipin synthase-like enzyme
MAMDEGHRFIVEAATRLAAQLPPQTLELVAKIIEDADRNALPSPRIRIAQSILQPYYRSLASRFFDDWQANAHSVSPEALALALRTASHVHRSEEESQGVELVWTGPDPDAVPFRRTEQAILQVLDSAARRITLVSFAVYRVPHIREALVRAASRGVRITVIVETPNRLEGENEYNTLQALGNDVASCSTVYYWPADRRGTAAGEKLGILHVKCAVADAHWLFLSSANLTEYAFTLNMELGVLMTGGPLPAQVEEHFDRLVRMRVLANV